MSDYLYPFIFSIETCGNNYEWLFVACQLQQPFSGVPEIKICDVPIEKFEHQYEFYQGSPTQISKLIEEMLWIDMVGVMFSLKYESKFPTLYLKAKYNSNILIDKKFNIAVK